MNRIAARAFAVLVLVIVLLSGIVFFLCEYVADAGEWIMFSGSPHLYDNGKISAGALVDRNGELLVELTDGRTYTADSDLRKAMLHWTGDRLGNIRLPSIEYYADAMLGYDLVNGIYSYGDAAGTIQLTLSASVQKAALEAMGDYVGTVAVYNYKTGALLCAVTTPTYDPENVPDIAGDTTGAYTGVYVNRFLQSKYIPGSVFKIVTLAAALESIPDIEERTFSCEGKYIIQNGDITCISAHGQQTLKECFSNSCNCAFAQIVELIGREKLARYVELFGITKPVSFDGITTAAGNFDLEGATAEQVAWSGIGQHKDQINPCAYLAFVGAVANGGTGVQPYVVSEVSVGGKATYEAKVTASERVISKETARTILEYMQNNVQVKYGAENFPGLTVCAKSGTGEVGGGKKPNAMFTGFLADEKYPLAFIVTIEEGGFGTQTCVPVITKVLDACVKEIDRS